MASFAKAHYYRYRDHIVCLVPDKDSPEGYRLVVPGFGKNMALTPAGKFYPRLPKKWRALIREALAQREAEAN